MNTQICNPDHIDDFLADRLNETQQSNFKCHLDECDRCCELLLERTAGVRLWDDAKNYLSSTDNLTAEPSANTQPFDPTPVDFLSATDDPRMLGRFGGYEITGVIGSGGMGIVLKGFDSALNRYAAIKVLAPHYATSGAARQRFAREAQAAAAVVHDNVIAIHGVDEFNNLPYLVMPYVKGESLQKRIDREGTLNTAETLRIATQIAKGLSAAHDQGLVHRDIKPGNILLPTQVERVIITDFGLARAADDASLTRSGVIAGTPQYMSPEQARGEGIDHRSDLFSLGSVMYAMCTGHPPFRAETPYGILRRITDNEPRAIREVNSDVPDWLCRIIDRLLAKDPAVRFSNATEVATLLEDCLAHVQHPTTVNLPLSIPQPKTNRALRRNVVMGLSAVAVLVAAWFLRPPNARDATDKTSEASNSTVAASESANQRANGSFEDDPISQENLTVDPQQLSEEELNWNMEPRMTRVRKSLDQLKAQLPDFETESEASQSTSPSESSNAP